MNKVDALSERIDEVEKRLDRIEARITDLERRMERHADKIMVMGGKR